MKNFDTSFTRRVKWTNDKLNKMTILLDYKECYNSKIKQIILNNLN